MEKVRPVWVVEDFLEDGSLKGLIDEVRSQGMVCEVIKYFPKETESQVRSHIPPNQPVVFYGSLDLGQKIRREESWIPGCWCNLNSFECTTYYAHWGKHLCNRNYLMLPTAEVLRRKDWLFSQFSVGNRIFIRPSTGYKSFTGKLFHRDTFQDEWTWVTQDSAPEKLLVISSPKKFSGEWRFVVVNKKVVSGTTYMQDGEKFQDPSYPQEAWERAQEMAFGEFQPDSIYTLDIALDAHSGAYGLMEANSFGCAGLYRGNLPAIVSAASELAYTEWADVCG